MSTLVFDIETDGLIHDNTKIHCMVIHELETGSTLAYNDQGNREPIVRGVQRLEDAQCIVGHNVIGFDIPCINKHYPWFTRADGVVDTLVLSRIYHADLLDLDKKRNWKGMPPKLYGSHSLEAYGYRTGFAKGDYGKDTDWKEWTPEMEEYCINDVMLTERLCKHFVPFLTS